jgi:hypothetical protein
MRRDDNAEPVTIRFQRKQQRHILIASRQRHPPSAVSLCYNLCKKRADPRSRGSVNHFPGDKERSASHEGGSLCSRRRRIETERRHGHQAHWRCDSGESHCTFARRASPRPPPIRTCISHCADRRSQVDAVASRLAMPPIVMTGLH